MQELCADRWAPLYSYARRKGLPPDRAEDIVQGLLLQLVEADFLQHLDPGRGRLRGYLKRALSHYLVNQHAYETALKRGGNAPVLPLHDLEARIGATPDDPEAAFDREWAIETFEAALADLESEYASSARKGPFSVLRELFRFGETAPYEDLAKAHGMTVGQLKSFVHRGRKRYRALVLARIADTVVTEEEAASELNDLLRALGS